MSDHPGRPVESPLLLRVLVKVALAIAERELAAEAAQAADPPARPTKRRRPAA